MPFNMEYFRRIAAEKAAKEAAANKDAVVEVKAKEEPTEQKTIERRVL